MVVAAMMAWAVGQFPEPLRPGQGPIRLGWHDEMDVPDVWGRLKMENQPAVLTPTKGTIEMILGRVPRNWPYTYQWSGLTQDASLDVGRFPCLSARVTEVRSGYAHLDIDVLNAEGKAVKTLRSPTLQAPGISTIDLRAEGLDPAVYHLRLRMIVGGPNDGCGSTYDWLRFTSAPDAERLKANPNAGYVVDDGRRFR